MKAFLHSPSLQLPEKHRVAEALWDDSCRQRQADIPVPPWHKDLLDSRDALVKCGQARFVDWTQAKSRLAARLR